MGQLSKDPSKNKVVVPSSRTTSFKPLQPGKADPPICVTEFPRVREDSVVLLLKGAE